MTKNRYASGVASRADVLQAETQLRTAAGPGDRHRRAAGAVGARHRIARSASPRPSSPFRCLRFLRHRRHTCRRPPCSSNADRISPQPRDAAAANAQIGVAEAAYYPNITLTASGGFEARTSVQVASMAEPIMVGRDDVLETVFDGGLRRAQTEQARAAYDANVASYRQTVLTGFQEVEDNLAALRILEEEAQVQDEAVKAAAAIRNCKHQPVQGRHRQLSRRCHGPDDRAEQ